MWVIGPTGRTVRSHQGGEPHEITDIGTTRLVRVESVLLATARQRMTTFCALPVVRRVGFEPPQSIRGHRVFDRTSRLENPHDLAEWRPWARSRGARAVLNVRFWDRSMSGGAAELGPEAAIQSQLETSF
jgi:hypothetical protein